MLSECTALSVAGFALDRRALRSAGALVCLKMCDIFVFSSHAALSPAFTFTELQANYLLSTCPACEILFHSFSEMTHFNRTGCYHHGGARQHGV